MNKLGFVYIVLLFSLISPLKAQAPQERVVSLDLEGADIRTVLRSFAELGEVNMVLTKSVKGTITVKLKNLPWKRALDIVLETNNLAMVEEEGLIKIMTRDELSSIRQTEDLETRVYPVKFADANLLRDVIGDITSPRGRIKVVKRTNSLVIADIPSYHKQIAEMIDKLDTPTPQVLIQAKIVQVQYGVSKQMGIKWYLGNLDNTKTKVHTGMTINTPPGAERGSIIFGYLLPEVNLDAWIGILEDQNKAELLSQPSIMVADNEPAMIMSGSKIPTLTRDIAGNTIVQYLDVALKLTVTPHISPDGSVNMELTPEISDIAGEAAGGVGYIISTQQANTKLTVQDGETVVIGGAIRKSVTKTKQGIPILSKIPIVGYLFSNSNEKTEKSELMIFITPKIVTKR